VDWATFVIEAIGVTILLLWVVIPIREFQGIFREIRNRGGLRGGEVGAADQHSGERTE
jgi:hypothetical protein